jgi:hypothetical protein
MVRSTRRLVLFLLLLASCSSFSMQHQEVFVRYRAHEDILDILIVYEGIGKGGAKVETAVQALQGIHSGRRHFLIWGWYLELDLERVAGEKAEEVEPGLQPPLPVVLEEQGYAVRNDLQAFLPNVEVLEARLLIDEQKGLCLVQRVRVRNALDGIRLLDESINLAVQMAFAQDDIDEFWTEDSRTLELLRTRVERGGGWLRFDGEVLDVSVPMTPRSAGRLVKETLGEIRRHPDGSRILGWILGPLESVSVTGEELRLRFAPGADGWIRWEIGDGDIPEPESITEALTQIEPIPAGVLENETERLKFLE